MMDTAIVNIAGLGGSGGSGGMGGVGGVSGGQGPALRIIANINAPYAQLDEYHSIMNFVSPINFLPTHQEIHQNLHKDTGKWLLEHTAFLEWKQGSNKLLWCSGIPGAGKTVLASLVFEHLNNLQDSDLGVACAYLNYKESAVQNLKNILGAIWRQLCSKHDLQSCKHFYMRNTQSKAPSLL
ncbi:NACHT and ankyrin domain protein [Mycena chlorophos]|uniref:NACHT and ankyrin domain protein n=1 Tax=Mycena chlorophos TaxID=658473 RepID=A0A8H6TJD7_MYCCL|nr:NACHT and ankyrin domain protein [Mycena chlorophos]